MAFELYLDQQVVPEGDARRRLMALALVTIFTASAGVLAVVADRMRVVRVTAPEGRAVIHDLDEAALPPPSPPPAAPHEAAATAAPQAEERVADSPREEPIEEEPALEPAPQALPRAAARAVPEGARGRPGPGVPGVPGVPGGTGSPVGPAVGIPALPQTPVTPATPAEGPPRKVDFSALVCRVCPDPAQADLQRALAGTGGGLKANRTRFCVGKDGRTSQITTARKSGNPEIDRLCREAVERWRFEPVRVDGKVRETCSTVSFDIERAR